MQTMADVVAPLRLVAFDEEDLAIISAHMQDATVKVADMAFLAGERRFALAGCRFDWERPQQPHRRLSGLHFDYVQHAATQGMPADAQAVLNLLAITFLPADPPGGEILLHFSGDTAVRLTVECVEAQMRDLGPCWEAAHCPRHGEEAKPSAPQAGGAR